MPGHISKLPPPAGVRGDYWILAPINVNVFSNNIGGTILTQTLTWRKCPPYSGPESERPTESAFRLRGILTNDWLIPPTSGITIMGTKAGAKLRAKEK